MALTTTQVNQAFLATLGRPAEGSAATWGSTSLSLDALLDSIFIAENTDGDFVEYLYQNILGRASDAEGKAFWNSLLATTSKEAVLAQFKAAVIAAGQADPSNADYQSFIAQNKAFVATLYANLLGRDDAKTADAEGIDFWANALATGMSRGDLISAFVSAALSDPNSDDAQTLNAKLSVADAFSAAFKDFGKDVTADEKKAALDTLKTTMTEVVAGSTVEEFQDTINQFKGQNQDRKTDVFTKGEDDLDASESTAATTFRGTINISNPDKSTIESGDAATGNSEYAPANTLIVDVKSDGKEKDFNFGTETAGVKVSNVNNLTINNGTADVTLNLTGGDNYTGKVAIAGKGDRADVTVAQDVASLNVSTSGTKKAYADTTVAANATLGSFEGSAAVDTLNINGTIAKSINTGDGKDEVTLGATAKVFEKATISLGGGDDTLTISTGDIGLENVDGKIAAEDLKASVTIDGGAGTKDKLVLNNSDISKGVKAITGVEFIDSTGGVISAAAADGLKTTVSGDLTINANYKEVKSINLKDIKSFTDNNKTETGSLSLSGITYENITLSSNIKENIVVDTHTAASPKNYAEINKFGEGDTIKVGVLSIAATQVNNKALDLTRYADVKAELAKTSANVLAINDVNGKKAYIWQVLDSTDARLVAIVDKKLKVDGTSFVYDNGKAPQPPVGPVVPGQPTGELKAQKVAGFDYYELAVNPPVQVSETGTTLKLAEDLQTLVEAETAKQITVNANGSGDISFDAAVKSSNQVIKVILQGTGTRTVDLENVNATAVKNITDGAANTTLDISNKTFNASSGADVFATGLKIDLGAGTDVVNIGNQTHASGAFALTGVEGIKASGGTLDAALVTKTANNAVTTDLTQIEGSLTLKNFAGATSIDLSNIKTAVTKDTALTIDIVTGTPVTAANLTSVKGSATANDTLVVSGNYTALDTIEGIDAITLNNNATLKAKAITSDTLAINGGHKLTVNASGETTVDLANLSKGTDTPTIEITNVGQGTTSGATITLNSGDGIAETIKLAANAKAINAVTVTGFKLGAADDKLNLQAIHSDLKVATVSGGVQAVSTGASTTLASDKVTTITATGSDLTVNTNVTLGTGNGEIKATALTQNTNYLIAIKANDSSKTAIYIANPGSDTTLTKGEITLIATVNGDLTADTNWLA
ncbi:DUF4214 domain-containing protein [Campylobacter magnus]|uniref:DUF4214 domain-containing protein n=1 Tax=Campylobacter magnus TaxID=3026462 RepID=UPI0026DEAD7B|nr:DUF4214 domain-containing protein [Campylobacter magnus]MDO2408015.1 DUF4214 domain-containing protein [Campylobacter magnus]